MDWPCPVAIPAQNLSNPERLTRHWTAASLLPMKTFSLPMLMTCLVLAWPVWADVSAVGRLENTSTNQTCTGTLVAPNVVLSAAHCVGALRDAPDTEAAQVVFRPGGLGGAVAFKVTNRVTHPFFAQPLAANGWKLRFDMALFALESDVPETLARPMPTGPEARLGETLFLVSWRARASAPPRQRACDVIDGIPGLVTVACAVLGGESGAPLLRKTPSGLELVAVLSSRSQQRKQPVALASNVALRLGPLLDALRSVDGS